MQGGCRSPSREVSNILRSGLPAEVPKAVFPWKCWRDLSGLRAPRMDLRGNSSVFPRNAVVCLSEEGGRQTLPWFLPECVRMSGKSHVHLDVTPAELGIPTSLLLESACCVRSPEGCSLGKRLCPEGAGKRGGGGRRRGSPANGAPAPACHAHVAASLGCFIFIFFHPRGQRLKR